MSTVTKSQATAAWERRNRVHVTLVPLRGGIDAVLFEDSPHSEGPNAVTEADEFAGDAAVAPRRVVGGHLDDAATQLHRGAGPPGRPARLGPVAGDSASVPAQQGLWCDEPAGLAAVGAGAAATAPSRARSSSASAGRLFCRCRTVSWWRSTMISRSFERPERTASRASNARNRYRMRHIGPQDASASCLVSAPDRILGTHVCPEGK